MLFGLDGVEIGLIIVFVCLLGAYFQGFRLLLPLGALASFLLA